MAAQRVLPSLGATGEHFLLCKRDQLSKSPHELWPSSKEAADCSLTSSSSSSCTSCSLKEGWWRHWQHHELALSRAAGIGASAVFLLLPSIAGCPGNGSWITENNACSDCLLMCTHCFKWHLLSHKQHGSQWCGNSFNLFHLFNILKTLCKYLSVH